MPYQIGYDVQPLLRLSNLITQHLIGSELDYYQRHVDITVSKLHHITNNMGEEDEIVHLLNLEATERPHLHLLYCELLKVSIMRTLITITSVYDTNTWLSHVSTEKVPHAFFSMEYLDYDLFFTHFDIRNEETKSMVCDRLCNILFRLIDDLCNSQNRNMFFDLLYDISICLIEQNTTVYSEFKFNLALHEEPQFGRAVAFCYYR